MLTSAAERGVDVRLYLPGANTDHASVRLAGRSHYEAFLNAGVKIFEGNERFSHTKALLIDTRVSIGSCNFDFWGIGWNREANLEIQDPKLLDQAELSLEIISALVWKSLRGAGSSVRQLSGT
ncbi:phospholipase D-like domain-containing protein [Pseudomonas sp. Q2-TVG4-2]|uniref:phospholipase D-like domain-containing protein n=1 Tax=Pseudomonas sp. Q2-TVG4-2 TaxID=1685699 RepID=UPI0035C6D0B8